MGDARMTRRLLWGGVIGPVVFVVGFMLIGLLRADYDPMRQFVSLLSLTDDGWQQVANFLVSGTLILAGAAGWRRVVREGPGSRWGPILIGLAGVGLILAGLFVTDPAQGYPPGTPPGLPMASSWHGLVHQLGSTLVFLGLPIAMFVMARRFRGDGSQLANYCRVSAVAMLIFFAAGFGLTDVTGLFQRISIVIAFAWVSRLSYELLGTAPEG